MSFINYKYREIFNLRVENVYNAPSVQYVKVKEKCNADLRQMVERCSLVNVVRVRKYTTIHYVYLIAPATEMTVGFTKGWPLAIALHHLRP